MKEVSEGWDVVDAAMLTDETGDQAVVSVEVMEGKTELVALRKNRCGRRRPL